MIGTVQTEKGKTMPDMMMFPKTVDEFMEQYKIVDSDEVYTNGTELVPIFRMKQWFEHAPTIDAAPVKHGEWIDDGGLYRCSSCNHLWSELWWTQNCPIERMLKIMPYCPNCGADMRERKADAVK